jgi:hypothetical protein
MPFSLTDEIIDAIIQNERRHVCQSGKRRAAPPVLRAANAKPDWGQLPRCREEDSRYCPPGQDPD